MTLLEAWLVAASVGALCAYFERDELDAKTAALRVVTTAGVGPLVLLTLALFAHD